MDSIESEHQMIEILRILNAQDKPTGSKLIADELKDKGCELYRISGLLESKDRINYHSIKETSIAGSFLFTCPMQNRRYMKAEEKLAERDIVNLCKQLNI